MLQAACWLVKCERTVIYCASLLPPLLPEHPPQPHSHTLTSMSMSETAAYGSSMLLPCRCESCVHTHSEARSGTMFSTDAISSHAISSLNRPRINGAGCTMPKSPPLVSRKLHRGAQ